MNRINVTVADLDGKRRVISHFDYDKIRRWSDIDPVSRDGSRGTGRGEAVVLTSQGRWVLEKWSNWAGEAWQHEYITADDAREWLIGNECYEAVAEFLGQLAEEEDRRPGRPAIGGGTHVNLGDLKPRVIAYAEANKIKLGEAVRQLVAAGLGAETGELRAALDTRPVPRRRVGRIDPVMEAGALAAEWVSTYRRTDDGWREVYTADEVAAVDAGLDLLVAQMPHPGRSLFFRRTGTC